MWRKTACALSGIILACAAVYGLTSIDARSSTANFDLRWLYPASKADPLPVVQVRPINADEVVMAFNAPSANTTVATKGPTMTKPEHYRVEEGIVRAGQSAQASRVKARTNPVNPVRTVPVDE